MKKFLEFGALGVLFFAIGAYAEKKLNVTDKAKDYSKTLADKVKDKVEKYCSKKEEKSDPSPETEEEGEKFDPVN